ICEVFGDVKGSPYSEEGSTMAILLKKPCTH
ncbi:MAG TPA: SAM-dependent methyltransferase, partial [Enterococcus sp.]|nr:SAM-dependent methyltransferase [Enterococcus sp.]